MSWTEEAECHGKKKKKKKKLRESKGPNQLHFFFLRHHWRLFPKHPGNGVQWLQWNFSPQTWVSEDPRELVWSSLLSAKHLGWEQKGQNELTMHWSRRTSPSRELFLHLFLLFSLPPSFFLLHFFLLPFLTFLHISLLFLYDTRSWLIMQRLQWGYIWNESGPHPSLTLFVSVMLIAFHMKAMPCLFRRGND